MKILVAEDDPIMLATVVRHLQPTGYNVITANDGNDALRMFEEVDPDMLITDILMPVTSGLELIGYIRNNLQKQIPIIVLSALDAEDTVMEAFTLGANDFMIKPFKANELQLRIKKLLKDSSSSPSK